MLPYSLILIVVFALVVVGAILAITKRIRTCPSDQILVKYGQIGGDQSAKTIHGGTTFVWPVIQGYRYLDLTPMTVDIKLEGALSKQNIRVNVPSRFTFGIGTTPELMSNAAERPLPNRCVAKAGIGLPSGEFTAASKEAPGFKPDTESEIVY